MLVSVLSRDVHLTRAERKLVVAAQGELEPRFRRIISIDFILEAERGRTKVSCRVHSASGYYRASATGRSPGEVIRQVIDRLLTQRRRRKAALVRGRHRALAGRRSELRGQVSGRERD